MQKIMGLGSAEMLQENPPCHKGGALWRSGEFFVAQDIDSDFANGINMRCSFSERKIWQGENSE
jgi:hypothetical protein